MNEEKEGREEERGRGRREGEGGRKGKEGGGRRGHTEERGRDHCLEGLEIFARLCLVQFEELRFDRIEAHLVGLGLQLHVLVLNKNKL